MVGYDESIKFTFLSNRVFVVFGINQLSLKLRVYSGKSFDRKIVKRNNVCDVAYLEIVSEIREKKFSYKARRVSILIAGISSGASKDLHRLKLKGKRVLKINVY